jgi:hypothetical protein
MKPGEEATAQILAATEADAAAAPLATAQLPKAAARAGGTVGHTGIDDAEQGD